MSRCVLDGPRPASTRNPCDVCAKAAPALSSYTRVLCSSECEKAWLSIQALNGSKRIREEASRYQEKYWVRVVPDGTPDEICAFRSWIAQWSS